MKYLQKNSIKKVILVLSDLHLSAGSYFKKKKNPLEDFHHDGELIDFLTYYSSNYYENFCVELVLNGDIFDLLAVPYVEYFDDEYWSEKAVLEKLKIVLEAHHEIWDSLIKFLEKENKTVKYIFGNHDAEICIPSVLEFLKQQIPEKLRDRFQFIENDSGEYSPHSGIVIKHGHEYEMAHNYNRQKSVIQDICGNRYFMPPWGSYYVTRVLNKFKGERSHVNLVRPIKSFIIYGLIYDTLFTLRFIVANFSYLIMVRVFYWMRLLRNFEKLVEKLKKEFSLFRDYETLMYEDLKNRSDFDTLITGHTHVPGVWHHPDGKMFINTGTWVRMHNLDFSRRDDGNMLTYAYIAIGANNDKQVLLNVWRGIRTNPFEEF